MTFSRAWPKCARTAATVLAAMVLGWSPATTVGAQEPPAASPNAFAAKADARLIQALAARSAAPLRVVYFLAEPTAAPATGRSPQALGRAAALGALRTEMASARAPVQRWLEATGNRVVATSDYAGAVVAIGDARSIEAAAADPRISEVYLETVHRPRLNVSAVVTQASIVRSRGINGSGAKVAIVEGGRVGSHPNLPTSRRLRCGSVGRGQVSEHKTLVAGVIQSTDGFRRGMAPGVTVIDAVAADFSEAELMKATDCAITAGAVAINMSFGADTDGSFTAFASYVDRIVYNTGVTIVVAVSNDCFLRMGSPEIAYNDISVGGFSDRGTTALRDDRHGCHPVVDTPFSAFRDPPSLNGDREQPDVVAPGHLIDSTYLEGFFGEVTGTSLSAPHVVGGVALLEDRSNRSNMSLAGQAERVRAILMASARHNIEGVTRLSDKDGAGAVRFAAAEAVLRANQSWWFVKPGSPAGFPHSQVFRSNAGEMVRVALVWAHKPWRGNRTVSTDLNLIIRDPSGVVRGSSTSKDNNFEVVEFVAPLSGNYRAQILNARSSSSYEHIGLAVSRSDQ